MSGFRLNAEDLAQRTQPIAMPPSPQWEDIPEPTFLECLWDVLPFVVMGLGFVIGTVTAPAWFPAIRRMFVAASIALLGACGGGDDEPVWPDDVNLAKCALHPDKMIPSSFMQALHERCQGFVNYQCVNGGEIPMGWHCKNRSAT